MSQKLPTLIFFLHRKNALMFYHILSTNYLRKYTEIRVENCYVDIEGCRNHYSVAYLMGCISVD